jgi:disease resistance protein RPM1
MKEPNTKA